MLRRAIATSRPRFAQPLNSRASGAISEARVLARRSASTNAPHPAASGSSSVRNLVNLAVGVAIGVAGGLYLFDRPSPAETTSLFGKFGTPDDFKAAIAELNSTLASNKVSTDPDVVKGHGFSANSYHPAIAHSVVIFPESTEDVVAVMKIATKYRMPVVAYSGGTSVEGHFSGVDG
ncbi:hypothetical protein FRC00_012192, partial [Tulasnella sp. 408]